MSGTVRALPALLFLSAWIVPTGCGGPEEAPLVHVHYLGHASFLLTFGPGSRAAITVLTDYGESRAYGLDSPIHPIGNIAPDVVTVSHDHADHAGGKLPPGSLTVLRGDNPFEGGALTITPIPTYEGSLEAPDNVSFLFSYKGLKILHLGDCQGLIRLLGENPEGVEETRDQVGALVPDRVRVLASERIRELYPDRYDVVLLPIGFTREILQEAATFASMLLADRIVPMHFWAPADRDRFLELLEGRVDSQGRPYRVGKEFGTTLSLFSKEEPRGFTEAVVLLPGPPA